MKRVFFIALLFSILAISLAPLLDSQSDLEVTDFLMKYLEDGKEIGNDEKLRQKRTVIIEIQVLNIGARLRNLSFSTGLENPSFYLDNMIVDGENVPVQLGKNSIRIIGEIPGTVADSKIEIIQCKNIGLHRETIIEGGFISKNQAFICIVLFCLVGTCMGAIVTFIVARMGRSRSNENIWKRQNEILADFFRNIPLTSEQKSKVKKLFKAMEKIWLRG